MPTLAIDNITHAEGNSGTTNFVFTVTLTGPTAQTVTVNYATADGTATAPSDYASAAGTLAFAPGTTTQTITVPVTGDVINEPDGTFTVTLSGPINKRASFNLNVIREINDNGNVINGVTLDPQTLVAESSHCSTRSRRTHRQVSPGGNSIRPFRSTNNPANQPTARR